MGYKWTKMIQQKNGLHAELMCLRFYVYVVKSKWNIRIVCNETELIIREWQTTSTNKIDMQTCGKCRFGIGKFYIFNIDFSSIWLVKSIQTVRIESKPSHISQAF